MSERKNKIKSGVIGENIAVEYLKRKGYIIKERNFRCKTGEIDIIAYDGSCLVFAEVKTRKSSVYGLPEEFVTIKKQQKLIKAAYYYLNGSEPELRFDVIGIIYSMRNGQFEIDRINHIKNAFMVKD